MLSFVAPSPEDASRFLRYTVGDCRHDGARREFRSLRPWHTSRRRRHENQLDRGGASRRRKVDTDALVLTDARELPTDALGVPRASVGVPRDADAIPRAARAGRESGCRHDEGSVVVTWAAPGMPSASVGKRERQSSRRERQSARRRHLSARRERQSAHRETRRDALGRSGEPLAGSRGTFATPSAAPGRPRAAVEAPGDADLSLRIVKHEVEPVTTLGSAEHGRSRRGLQ